MPGSLEQQVNGCHEDFQQNCGDLPMPLCDLMVCLALSSLALFVIEIENCLMRRGAIYSS